MPSFEDLEALTSRPAPFSVCTRRELWTGPHLAAQMLRCHLDPDLDAASRRLPFVEASARWMVERFDLGPGRAVLDLGCGPGLYTNRLARSGAEVTGVDFSAHSLAYAAREAEARGLAVDYRCADYLELDVRPRHDLVTTIMCDYCAIGPGQRARLLERVRAALRPGGRFLFDVHTPALLATRREGVSYEPGLMDGFWAAEPYHGFHAVVVYGAERVTLDRYLIVTAERQATYFDWLQCFDPESVRAEVEAAGLVVEEILGDVAGAPYDPDGTELAVVARRP